MSRVAVVLLVLTTFPLSVRADGGELNVRFEPAAALFVDEPQRTEFGVGRDVTLRGEWSPVPMAGIELAIGQMQFLADQAPEPGRAWTFMAGGRLRPFDDGSWTDRARRGRSEIGLSGLWGGLQLGLVQTEGLSRFGLGLAGGIDVPVAQVLSVGPFMRYQQVFQPDSEPGPDDAQILVIGLSLLVGFAHPEPIAPEPPPPPPPPPPADTDGDGLTDDRDRCPREAEDRDQFQDDDGCPDPDNDGDGILDGSDRCPNEAETVNGNEDQDGCPDEAPQAVVTSGQIVINDQINFEYDSAELLPSSHPILNRVAEVILEHPQITRIRIEGHTDERGTDAWNNRLSTQRAQAVMRYLVGRGVPAERLEAVGYGKSRPIDPAGTDEAHAQNRRVEFHLVSTE